MDIIDLLLTPVKLVPVIAGAIFLALGVNIFLYQRRFEAKAKAVPGKVVAIERYTSASDSSADRETGTCYRSWIEYANQGKVNRTYSSTASWAQHAPGETVTVLLHQSKEGARTQSSVKERRSWLMPLGFSAAGLGAFDMAFAQETSLLAIAVIAILFLVLGYLISSRILEAKTLTKLDHIDQFELHTDGRLFRTPGELSREMNKRHNLRNSCC